MTATKHKGFVVENVGNAKADWYIYTDLCKGCGLCMVKCPKKCIEWSKEMSIYQTPAVEPRAQDCIACGTCALVCPDSAIRVEKKV